MHMSSKLLSTFVVFWHITDMQLYVLLWAIASSQVACFKCLLHAVPFVNFSRKHSFIECNNSFRVSNRFLSTRRETFFLIPLGLYLFSNHSFDPVLHRHQGYNILSMFVNPLRYTRNLGDFFHRVVLALPNVILPFLQSDNVPCLFGN